MFLLSFLLSSAVFSQQQLLHDPVSGRIFSSERYSGINGSPFLFDKWIKGSVTIDKGVYQNLELKLDTYSNKLYFNQNDEPYEFGDDVTSFVLYPKVTDSSSYMYFKSGLQGDGLRPSQFVQVIMDIEQNKLSTKKTSDLVQILKYYNSL